MWSIFPEHCKRAEVLILTFKIVYQPFTCPGQCVRWLRSSFSSWPAGVAWAIDLFCSSSHCFLLFWEWVQTIKNENTFISSLYPAVLIRYSWVMSMCDYSRVYIPPFICVWFSSEHCQGKSKACWGLLHSLEALTQLCIQQQHQPAKRRGPAQQWDRLA